MKKITRLDAKTRKKQILEIAIDLSIKIGYQKVTRERIANQADIALSTVTFHFKKMADLKRAVMREAIKKELNIIIAQGLLVNDPIALKAPKTLRDRITGALV